MPGLTRSTLLVFNLPALGVGFLNTLSLLYLFKYATDVLLIAPAAIGFVFMLGRLWDAASDPLAGYLSDRTQTRWGRRRPWLLASAPLFLVCPLMIWVPPQSLSGTALLVWVGVGMLALDTAFTAFFVPHGALATELSLDHHDRTRIFAYRQAGMQIGAFLGLAGLYVLASSADKRGAALWLVGLAGAVCAVLIATAALRLRERTEFLGRGAAQPLSALRDVLRNPHARVLLAVLLIENLGQASLMVLAPYYVEYVLGDEKLLPLLAGPYMVASLLVVPVGLALSRRLGKKRVWLFCMLLTGLAYGSMFFAGHGDALYVSVIAALIGIGNGVGLTVGASVQADIVDYDEYATGERKEGIYFAAWNIVRKAASGLTGFLAGIALQEIGFTPNVEQTESTRLMIRSLMSLTPLVAFAIGLVLFARFGLDEAEHRRIRLEIEKRARDSAPEPVV